MSADVESNFPTTTTTTMTTSSPELPTMTSTSTPMSSSSTTASAPPLPSLSTPLPLLSIPPFAPSPSPSASSPPSTSTSPTMTTSTITVPTTTIPTTVTPTTTVPTTTISITITPTTTITTTTSISIPTTIPSSELPPTISPTSTSTTTVIPPTTSVGPTTPTSFSTPITSSMTSWSSSTYSGQSMTPSTIASPTTRVAPTLLTGSRPIPTPEAMLSSPTPIGPMSTFSTTVYISTTDTRGSMTVYTPSFFTTTMTLMGTGGSTTTSTGVFANPTLNTDTSSPSSFFQNKGAVAGVFTLVGIAIISIIIWIILFIRRRRREQGLEHDSAIFASLFEAGVDRIPIESESSASSHHSRYDSAEFLAIPMANSNPERHRRSTSGLLGNNSRRRSIMPDAYHEDRGQYDPYIEYGPRNSRDSYRDMPSPTTPHLNIPPPSAFAPYRDRSNDGMGMVEVGTGLPIGAGIVYARHSHSSSFEPLLASHQRRNGPFMLGRGLDVTNLSNGRASRTPSTDNGSSASTSKPSYLPSLMHPNFYTTNTSSHSAILINGREDHGSGVNSVDANGEIKKPDVLVDSEISTTEDEHELELRKPVLAVRNLPDAASTLSLS